MNYDYDVVVVGARVAGAATAMLLARRGHRVLLVDRAPIPSDTLSTHAVLRTGVLQLERWGLATRITAAGTPVIRDIVLGFGDQRIRFEVKDEFSVDYLFAPRRYLLDGLLVEAAAEAGAEVRDRCRMRDVIRSDRRVEGITVEANGRTNRVTSRFVVGADGVRSRVASRVGASVVSEHVPTNAINYAYFADLDVDGFWFQFTPGLNAGFIPSNDGVCVFAGRPAQRLPDWRRDPDGEFRSLIAEAGGDLAERLDGATRVTDFRGTPGLPGVIRQPAGPGWVLVGDAAYTKDPISAHGISQALRDAELCARAVDRTLRGSAAEAEAMAGYKKIRDSLEGGMFETSRELAAFEWDAARASTLMRVISDGVRDECAYLADLPEWTGVVTAA